MKQVYMPPRNCGHFVQDMPPMRVNWLAFWRLAYRDDAEIAHLSIIKAYGPTYGVWVQLEEI